MTEIKRKILDDVISKISKAKYNDVGPILLQARGTFFTVACRVVHGYPHPYPVDKTFRSVGMGMGYEGMGMDCVKIS